jgi:thiol-disulfide isomerase/thioredoxin
LKKLIAILLVGLGIGVVLTAYLLIKGQNSEGDQTASELMSMEVSYAVSPIYSLEMTSQDGNQIRLADYLGKPLVINFWASWCTPCKQELPLLQSAYQENSPDIEFIGINMAEPVPIAQEVINEFNLSFLVLMDDESKAADIVFIQALPTTLFFDANGQLLSRHIGLLNEELLGSYLEKIGQK